MTRAAAALALAALLPATGSAQAVRLIALDEALRIAAEANPDAASARLHARSAEAAATQASAFLWPVLGVEAAGVATDDPVGAFGIRLRQGRFTQADLALDALNHPDAVTDWSAAAAVRWAGLDPARWAERDAALLSVDASRHGARRAGEAAVFTAHLLYIAAVQTEARLEALEIGEAAAAATVDRLTRRRREGLATDADALQAEAALADARARRIRAQAAVADARGRLGVHLGWPADVVPAPADALAADVPGPEADAASLGAHRADAESTAGESGERSWLAETDSPASARSDLRASLARLDAARARVSAARARRLPVAEAFVRAAGHASGDLDAGRNWTAGVQVSVPLFSGFAVSAGVEAARVDERLAEVEHARRVREADADAAEARRTLASARLGLEAARAASEAAEEARRLVARRFEEGLATVDELLGAEARAAVLRTAAVDALASLHVAAARLEFELGRTPVPPGADGGASQPTAAATGLPKLRTSAARSEP